MKLLWVRTAGENFLGEMAKLSNWKYISYVGSKSSCRFAAERLNQLGCEVETFTSSHTLDVEAVLANPFVIIDVQSVHRKSRVGLKLIEIFRKSRNDVVLCDHSCKLVMEGIEPRPNLFITQAQTTGRTSCDTPN